MSTSRKAGTKSEVAEWWANNPMTYGSKHGGSKIHGLNLTVGTREYFEELDNEFAAWNQHLHGERLFSEIFPYERYVGKRVLEVGCGQGTMASVWAKAGANVTAVDLNPQAVEQTRRRFGLFGLEGTVQEADARGLQFADEYFDYVYSWGVLHHSKNLAKSLSELLRVLKPGGEFGVMLYNRRSFLQWWIIQYFEGFVHYESRFLNRLELASRYTDGLQAEGNPHTWPVTKKEIRHLLGTFSDDVEVSILDEALHIGYYLPPRVRNLMPRVIQKAWARRFGWSIWTHGSKKRDWTADSP